MLSMTNIRMISKYVELYCVSLLMRTWNALCFACFEYVSDICPSLGDLINAFLVAVSLYL